VGFTDRLSSAAKPALSACPQRCDAMCCVSRAHACGSRWSVLARCILLSSPLISRSLVLIITVRDARGDELNAHASLSVSSLIRLHRVPGSGLSLPFFMMQRREKLLSCRPASRIADRRWFSGGRRWQRQKKSRQIWENAALQRI
jgi:hypothetical protein